MFFYSLEFANFPLFYPTVSHNEIDDHSTVPISLVDNDIIASCNVVETENSLSEGLLTLCDEFFDSIKSQNFLSFLTVFHSEINCCSNTEVENVVQSDETDSDPMPRESTSLAICTPTKAKSREGKSWDKLLVSQ